MHIVSRVILIVVFLAFELCWASGATPPPPPFQSATAGYRYNFPRDHGSHPTYRTEWWYYTGHLHATSGRSFGFELTFFRRGVPPDEIKTLPSKWSVRDLYLAHFAVTDITGKRFHFSEKLSSEGLEKAGADEIMCMIQMGTVPQEACMETIREWGRNVIPHFRRG